MTFTKVSAKVNGVAVESGYTLKNGDVVVISAPAGSISVNEEEYFENTSLIFSNENIDVTAVGISMMELIVTINFSIT